METSTFTTSATPTFTNANPTAAIGAPVCRRWVYDFAEGNGRNKMLLGGKGANLCEMTQIGLNVPPGFVITTEACLAYPRQQAAPVAGRA